MKVIYTAVLIIVSGLAIHLALGASPPIAPTGSMRSTGFQSVTKWASL
jgi:hypothetical protein